MAKLFIISTWFQVIWFAAVVGGENYQWVTIACVVATYAITLMKHYIPLEKVVLLSLLGIAVDYANIQFELLRFEIPEFPLWLLALWFAFLWYAYYLMPFLTRYPVFPVSLLGGFAGMASYFAGNGLGAVTFPNSVSSTAIILFVEWFVIIFVICRVYRYANSETMENKLLCSTDWDKRSKR